MTYGQGSINLRPIKFAFLVNPHDTKSLLKVIRINTFLWGGTYNPIIPVLKRTPKVFQNNTSEVQGIKNIVAGYIDAFDPDYVVEVTPCSYLSEVKGFRSCITLGDITVGLGEYLAPSYGIGLFEILDHFIKSELKYVRQNPLEITILSFREKYHLFLASIFGELQPEVNHIFNKYYLDRLNAKKVDCDISNYHSFLKPDILFFRRLSSLYFEILKGGYNKTYFFYLDATNPFDVIDFWNLRALGEYVIPIPKQIAYTNYIEKYLQVHIQPLLSSSVLNSPFGSGITILKARNIESVESKQFSNHCRNNIIKRNNQIHLYLQNFFPRIWDKWGRIRDFAECCFLTADSIDFNITNDNDQINCKILAPKFIRYEGFGQSRFANEIKIRTHGSKIPIAEVIPEGDERLTRVFSPSFIDKWRFSKRNIVYFATHLSTQLSLKIPKAADIFKNWLKLNGWNVELSSVGYIAAQMIENLHGINGINILASKEIIDLLIGMEKGKYKQFQEIRESIKKHVKHLFPHLDTTQINENAEMRLQNLIDLNILETGIEMQCPICQQHSWFSLNGIHNMMNCPKCTKQFKFPTNPQKDTRWVYRTVGPFSLPKRAYGIYSNLLTLRFFSQLLTAPTTPLIGFRVKKDSKEIEIDLGLFFKDSEFSHESSKLIIAECKTYNSFEKKDVNRMKTIAKKFPGAVLVFSTLNNDLTNKEKDLLRPFVKRCRKYEKTDSSHNLILILTGTELFAFQRPPGCWKEAGGKHRTFAKKSTYRYTHPLSFDLLCDLTQQKYLGLPPRQDKLIKKLKQRAKSKALKNPEKKHGKTLT